VNRRRCVVEGCDQLVWVWAPQCSTHDTRPRYRPTPAEEAVWEAEWRERQAIESPENEERMWLEAFAAADADPMKGRHTYSARPELNRPRRER